MATLPKGTKVKVTHKASGGSFVAYLNEGYDYSLFIYLQDRPDSKSDEYYYVQQDSFTVEPMIELPTKKPAVIQVGIATYLRRSSGWQGPSGNRYSDDEIMEMLSDDTGFRIVFEGVDD